MLTLSCPSCGANVEFKSKASVFAVCSYCKSSLVRQDLTLETYGKIADLQDDFTPLQLGTIGKFENATFELIGRLRVAYDDGFWNEWYLQFSSGDNGWLAEAQGFYAVCLECPNMQLPNRSELKIGRELTIPGEGDFEVDDMRDVVCTYSEGELPLRAPQGRSTFSVDLRGPKLKMATLEYTPNQYRIFVGEYKDFDELAFKNLRKIDGW